METGINVSSTVTEQKVKAVTNAVVKVIEACASAHLSDDNTKRALSVLTESFAINGLSISNCSINNTEKAITMSNEENTPENPEDSDDYVGTW